MDKLLDWLRSRIGRPIDLDGAYGPQCVDLVNDCLARVYGLPPLPGNAIDLARARPRGFVWVPNGPRNHPPAGSVVVWGGPNGRAGTGAAGHCAIALAASSMVLLSFDQNWPVGSPPSLVLHSYDAVLGWLAPLVAQA